MQTMNKGIEKSARKVFRLFLGSRLYMRKKHVKPAADVFGVDIMIDFNGRKKMSLFMDRKAVNSVMEKFTGGADPSRDDLAFDVVSEMANMIAGGFITSSSQDAILHAPSRSDHGCDFERSLNFSSGIGRMSICIEETL
jgi:CheY-specific phosphatase CheX